MMDIIFFGPHAHVWYFALAATVLLAVLWYLYVHAEKTNHESYGRSQDVPFGYNLTKRAKEGLADPVIGREGETDRLIHILSRRRKNNPLLLGPAGVGKTAVVEGLALRLATGDVPDHLIGKELWVLNITELLAGTRYRGDFEKRAQAFINSIRASQRNIIIFIDEIHMLVQTKGAEGAVNFTDILKPALARGELQMIGATTLDEYNEFIKPDETLERRFQIIMVDEPSLDDAIKILHGVRPHYEDFHKVRISDDAIDSAVRWSHEYIKERRLPDKAIDLIDEASASVKVQTGATPESAIGLLHHAAYTSRCLFDECPPELMKLKDQLSELNIAIQNEQIEQKKVALNKQKIEVVTHIEKMEKNLTKKEGKPSVQADDIKKIVALWAGIPLSEIH